MLDIVGNGKRTDYVEPNQPVDPTKDKRINARFYALMLSHVDSSVWGVVREFPGRMICMCACNHMIIGLDVIRPKGPLGIIALTDFPMPHSIIKTLLEAPQLLILANMQIKLHNHSAIARQSLFKMINHIAMGGPLFFA